MEKPESLRLSNNRRLKTLPDGLFDGLSSLQVLDLSGNQFKTLPEGLFQALDSLICLSLYGNELTTLPAGVFDGLTNLQELDLRKNHLVGLTRDDPLFAEMGSLKHLRL